MVLTVIMEGLYFRNRYIKKVINRSTILQLSISVFELDTIRRIVYKVTCSKICQLFKDTILILNYNMVNAMATLESSLPIPQI